MNVLNKHPLEKQTEIIKELTQDNDFLVLQKVNRESKTIPLRLEMDTLNKVEELAKETGKNRTELLNLLIDYAIDRIKLV